MAVLCFYSTYRGRKKMRRFFPKKNFNFFVSTILFMFLVLRRFAIAIFTCVTDKLRDLRKERSGRLGLCFFSLMFNQ